MSKKMDDDPIKKERIAKLESMIVENQMEMIKSTVRSIELAAMQIAAERQAMVAFLEASLQEPPLLLAAREKLIPAALLLEGLLAEKENDTLRKKIAWFQYVLEQIGRLATPGERFMAIIRSERNNLLSELYLCYARSLNAWERLMSEAERNLLDFMKVVLPSKERQPWYKRLFSWMQRKANFTTVLLHDESLKLTARESHVFFQQYANHPIKKEEEDPPSEEEEP